jgi:Fe-S cluster assembly protein SufD
MIRVDPGAQHTDAFQESRNLILSDGAHADAIPGLEIEANDVRCTHAATIGRIDAEQVFYLMSRGLTRSEAERLLVGGFLEVIAGRLEDSPFLHDVISSALERELDERVLV